MKVERVLILFICLMMIFFGFQCGKNRNAPDHLIGVWGTSDPGYADRNFEITGNEIIFQTGETTFDTYSIKSIEMEKVPRGQSLLYTITYKNVEGLKYKFSFYYQPAGQGEIRFKNQDQILWTKEKK
jgi:hypothetical protein